MREKFSRAMPIFYVTGMILILGFIILFSKMELGVTFACPLKYLFDYDCPGCGVTRMCISILKGEFYQAFRYNPFVFVTAPFICILYVWQAIVFIWQGKIIKYLDIVLFGYALALTIFGMLRNLEPFTWLAPTMV